MHKLLARQLQRFGGSTEAPPGVWSEFLAALDSAYEQSDADRLQLERSLDLASQELMDRYRQLQADIVERQRTESDLERSLSMLQATLDSTTDGIVVVDRQHRITEFNQKFVDMWSISEDMMVDRDADALFAHVINQVVDPVAFEAIRRQSLTIGALTDDVIELTDGRTFERHSQPQWLVDEWVGNVLSFHDITAERRRAEEALRKSEEELRQAQKMEAIGKLAGGVAHDFNNLLTAVTGFSELALSHMSPDDPLRAYLEEISKAGERGAALTAQLLAFGRRQVLQPAVLSLSATVDDMSRLLRRLIGEDVKLTTVIADELWLVRADPGQIGQVVLNLATNARDAMPRGGELTIEAANVSLDRLAVQGRGISAGDYVALRVRDTGVGISSDVLPNIFEPFFTTKGIGKGTGLGLSTVYGIVKQSGGEIEVSSTPGRGTIFTIYLPKHAVPADSPDNREPPRFIRPTTAEPLSSDIGLSTLLLVEDEAPVRTLAAAILESTGHRVLSAGSGEEALDLCSRYDGPIDLLLTDVVMPGMSGLELSEHIGALRPEIKVLYMSGFTSAVTLKHGVASGNAAFLQKPFTAAILSSKVRAVLAGH